MKDNCSRKFWCGRAAENIARGMLVAFAALAISGIASAQDKQDKKEEFNFDLSTAPVTPPAITPPVGNRLFLAGHAFGSQGYVCLPLGSGVSWTVNNARPEATLFANVFGEPVQIITHFLSHNDNPRENIVPPFGNATWQSSFDSSKVWAAATPATTIVAGTPSSVPDAGARSCLLLPTVGERDGPAGRGNTSQTTLGPSPESEG